MSTHLHFYNLVAHYSRLIWIKYAKNNLVIKGYRFHHNLRVIKSHQTLWWSGNQRCPYVSDIYRQALYKRSKITTKTFLESCVGFSVKMVCIPCIVIPVLLWVFHRYIQPFILKFWNPWEKKSVENKNAESVGGEPATDLVSMTEVLIIDIAVLQLNRIYNAPVSPVLMNGNFFTAEWKSWWLQTLVFVNKLLMITL